MVIQFKWIKEENTLQKWFCVVQSYWKTLLFGYIRRVILSKHRLNWNRYVSPFLPIARLQPLSLSYWKYQTKKICSLKQLQAYSPTERLPSRDENKDYMKYHVHIEKHVFSPNLVVKEEQAWPSAWKSVPDVNLLFGLVFYLSRVGGGVIYWSLWAPCFLSQVYQMDKKSGHSSVEAAFPSRHVCSH